MFAHCDNSYDGHPLYGLLTSVQQASTELNDSATEQKLRISAPESQSVSLDLSQMHHSIITVRDSGRGLKAVAWEDVERETAALPESGRFFSEQRTERSTRGDTFRRQCARNRE